MLSSQSLWPRSCSRWVVRWVVFMALSRQGGSIKVDELADALDGEVRRRIGREDFRIERVMSLARQDARQAAPPGFLHRRKDGQLVVHHDVVAPPGALPGAGAPPLPVECD